MSVQVSIFVPFRESSTDFNGAAGDLVTMLIEGGIDAELCWYPRKPKHEKVFVLAHGSVGATVFSSGRGVIVDKKVVFEALGRAGLEVCGDLSCHAGSLSDGGSSYNAVTPTTNSMIAERIFTHFGRAVPAGIRSDAYFDVEEFLTGRRTH
jgi:hypothetical protein